MSEQAPEYVYSPRFSEFFETCRVGALGKDGLTDLCLGILARCYPHVTPDLRLAIENASEWATHLCVPGNKEAATSIRAAKQ